MKTTRATAAALLAASVLLHVAALLFLLDMLAPRRGQERPSTAMEVVWATPAEPVVVPPIDDPLPRPKVRLAPRRAVARPADTARQAAPAPVAAAEVAAPARPEPVFDRQAALAAARKLAGEADPARAGTVGAELDARKVVAETETERLGRAIASGKRSDCVKANGGGSLLTPLLWLLDKKGSGCKL